MFNILYIVAYVALAVLFVIQIAGYEKCRKQIVLGLLCSFSIMCVIVLTYPWMTETPSTRFVLLAPSLITATFYWYTSKVGVSAIVIGTILNTVVVVANDMKMVGSLNRDMQYTNSSWILMDENTQLNFLGDWIPLLYSNSHWSPGDVIICGGMYLLMYQLVRYIFVHKKERRTLFDKK